LRGGGDGAANATDATDATIIRQELPASPVFPIQSHTGGGARRGATAFSGPWLPDEALEELLREYRARSAPDLRVSEAAKGLIRTVVESNAEAAMRAAAKRAPKSRAVTAAHLRRAGDAMALII
jgi:histone H3/H4